MKRGDMEEILRRRIDNVLAREREKVKKNIHENNVASVVGFASQLMPLLKNCKYPSSEALSDKAREGSSIIADIQRRSCDSLRDFRGTVAIAVLADRFPSRKKNALRRPCDDGGSVYTCTEK